MNQLQQYETAPDTMLNNMLAKLLGGVDVPHGRVAMLRDAGQVDGWKNPNNIYTIPIKSTPFSYE